MQKIKRKILEDFLSKCKSDVEFDLFIYLSQYQDDAGWIRDITYKFVCLEIKTTSQSFYNALYSLENKGYILLTGKHGKFDIKIIDNYFLSKNDYKEGYLDLQGFSFVFSHEFRSKSLKSKLLTLRILLNFDIQKTFRIGIEKIRSYINKDEFTVRQHISELEEFFTITEKKDGLFLFSIKKKKYLEVKETNLWKMVTFRVIALCQRFKISYTSLDLFDLYYIFKTQYKKFYKIINAFYKSSVPNRMLEPRLINYLVNNN